MFQCGAGRRIAEQRHTHSQAEWGRFCAGHDGFGYDNSDMLHNRREFLASAATLTALSQKRILGANDRIRVGAIGTGGRSRELLHCLKLADMADLVAVCDVYAPRRAQAADQFGTNASQHVDYREILDNKDIDAVVIAAPDHWHVKIASDAVAAGKDVYVEKPVTHNLEQGPALIKAVRATDRIVQCGMQQRSWEHFQTAAEMVFSGKIGQVTQVRTYWFQNYQPHGPAREVDASKLDWKRWLGSAPEQPFDQDRFYVWRWYWDFGGGAMTDLFTHWIDVAQWAMQSDTPQSAIMMGNKYVFKQRDCPDTLDAAVQYPNWIASYDGTMISSVDDGGLEFRGTEATIKLNRHSLRLYREGNRFGGPETEIPSKDDGTVAHMRNFLECVRSRKQPNAPVETGVAAARPGHLANLAYRAGKSVTLDAAQA